MKRHRGHCWRAVPGALSLMAAAQARAEMISHHTATVEANSRAAICIACHAGKTAKHVAFCAATCDYASSHAVMNDYPPAGKADKYATAAVLQAKAIKLEDRKVTCISYHDLRKTGRYHLVMSSTKSRRCLACHVTI